VEIKKFGDVRLLGRPDCCEGGTNAWTVGKVNKAITRADDIL